MILDNLIAQGKVKPMIVVMPLGYGTMEVIARGWQHLERSRTGSAATTPVLRRAFQEVMPLVKKQYPLSEKREDHAVAGLSMGGAESLLVGLNHIDDFAYVGGFSSAPLGGEQGDFAVRFPGITAAVGAEDQCPAAECSGLHAEPKTACSIPIRNSSPG